MKNIIIYIILIGFLVSCNKSNTHSNIYYMDVKNLSSKDLSIFELVLEDVKLDEVESSGQLFYSLLGNKIRAIDKQFGWVWEYDINAKLISQNLGRGGGPTEVNTSEIMNYVFNSEDNSYIFLGPSSDFHYHNSGFSREKISILNYGSDHKDTELLKRKADPEHFRMYNLDYFTKIINSPINKRFIMALKMGAPNFNATQLEYFQNARVFCEIDKDNTSIRRIIGAFPPNIVENKNRWLFSQVIMDNYDDKICYSFESDSLIYITNKDLSKAEISFGNSINSNKIEYPILEECNTINSLYNVYSKSWRENRNKYAYNVQLKYFPDKDLVFRLYHKPNNEFDGLQIYKNHQLIGDVNVPKNMKIIGKNANYFFASVENEETGSKIIKFKI
jgi:hypothetical protein